MCAHLHLQGEHVRKGRGNNCSDSLLHKINKELKVQPSDPKQSALKIFVCHTTTHLPSTKRVTRNIHARFELRARRHACLQVAEFSAATGPSTPSGIVGSGTRLPTLRVACAALARQEVADGAYRTCCNTAFAFDVVVVSAVEAVSGIRSVAAS